MITKIKVGVPETLTPVNIEKVKSAARKLGVQCTCAQTPDFVDFGAVTLKIEELELLAHNLRFDPNNRKAREDILDRVKEFRHEREQLVAKMRRDRQRLALKLLLVMFSADLCCECANDFSAEMQDTSRGEEPAEGNGILRMVKEARRTAQQKIDDVCMTMAKMSQLADDADFKIGTAFAEYSEQFTDHFLPIVQEFVKKMGESKRFKRFF